MNEKQDRLSMLKSKYSAEISKKESELKDLHEKLRLIDELESDAVKLTPTPSGELKYANGKTQLIDAVLESVNTIGAKGVAAGKIAKYLKENGFPINGNNFNISVGTSLRRLASPERNEIKSDKKGGSRVYSPIDRSEFR